MTDKEKAIKKLKEVLDGLDITNKYRLNLIEAIECLQDGPVSEDLDEASEKFRWNIEESCCQNDNGTYIYSSDNIEEAFKAGAKWQKEQDQSTIELAEDHAMFAGMEKMKEEMMSKAIDGYVIEDVGNGNFLLSANYLPKSMGLKDQQDVKVIVIKED